MQVGFIGLGQMGKAIVGHLLSSGQPVRVWNRSPEPVRELVARGAESARSPAELAESADVIMTMLANDAAVRSVIVEQGVLDAAKPGLVHINLATVSVVLAREFTALHGLRGIGYVAAPVFGRPEAAAAGKLHVVAAGDPATLARVQPVLDAIGQKVWPAGAEPERANAIKIAGNFMIASAIETMGEAVALTRAYGVSAGDFLEILTNTLFAAPVYQGYGAMIAAQRYRPAGFPMPLALKDVRLALEAAEPLHVPLPLASLLRDHLLEAIATGSAEDDWAGLARLAARRAGLG
ncbi:MAG TPA: NAD(P)-dependent oxidoreductase [Steroidobacteraceae bacterium]|nr:NAD(P)-dependent oxidoreductase [Steroidobacteraceae bacterium]